MVSIADSDLLVEGKGFTLVGSNNPRPLEWSEILSTLGLVRGTPERWLISAVSGTSPWKQDLIPSPRFSSGSKSFQFLD